MAHSKSSRSHYALTAIGIGLLILGAVMAVWNLVPGFGSNDKPSASAGNSSKPENPVDTTLKSKTFSVAYVLVGSGIALILLSICLSIRNKRKRRPSMEETRVVQHEVTNPRENGERQEEEDFPRYSAPSYEEVMRGYEVREAADTDGNQRMSLSLPSYESLTELDESAPTRPTEPSARPEQPQRTDSRSGKEKRPLHVRRIKSDKLHMKEFRLHFSHHSKLAETQKIEPITPPPQYEEKKLASDQPQ